MTTIVWRDGILAADSRVSASGMTVATVSKVWRTVDGSLWAFAGRMGFMAACRAWSEGPADTDPPKITDSTLVQITAAGACRELTESGWIEGQTAPFLAWGSGEQVATGALAMGATAAEAVEIACRYDQGSGAPVTVLALNESQSSRVQLLRKTP